MSYSILLLADKIQQKFKDTFLSDFFQFIGSLFAN